jgi:hypothetical protein
MKIRKDTSCGGKAGRGAGTQANVYVCERIVR